MFKSMTGAHATSLVHHSVLQNNETVICEPLASRTERKGSIQAVHKYLLKELRIARFTNGKNVFLLCAGIITLSILSLIANKGFYMAGYLASSLYLKDYSPQFCRI